MKKKITKDLKRMGLIPTKKKQEEMKIVGWLSLLCLLVMFSVWGAYKYPHYMIQPGLDYLDYNLPANHYSYIAWYEETPECGNDPYFDFPWKGTKELTKKA